MVSGSPCITGSLRGSAQVLASLEKQSSQPPEPFPLHAQYVPNIAGLKGEDGDSEASGDEDVGSKKPRAKGKKPSNKTNRGRAKATSSKQKTIRNTSKPITGETSCSDGGWQYGAVRNAFIQDLRSKGVGFGDAKPLWDSSEQKTQILSAVTVQELKRRKFLPKGACENPWFQKLHGPTQ